MHRLLILLAFIIPAFCFSQNYGICMQVIGSTGGSGAQGNYDVTWTVGETVVKTLVGNNKMLSQGFQQPDICTSVSTWSPDIEALGIQVFPNPVTTDFTIRYTPTAGLALKAEAFDLLGHRIMPLELLDNPDGVVVDCTSWPPGIYVLNFYNASTRAFGTVKVVRL